MASVDYKQKQIIKLMKQIIKAKKAYYSGEPIISDFNYDIMEKNLSFLDPENSVLKMVGYDSSFKVPKVL